MKKQIILLLVFATTFGSVTFAQDAPVKKEAPKMEVKSPKKKIYTKKTVKKVVKKGSVKKRTVKK